MRIVLQMVLLGLCIGWVSKPSRGQALRTPPPKDRVTIPESHQPKTVEANILAQIKPYGKKTWHLDFAKKLSLYPEWDFKYESVHSNMPEWDSVIVSIIDLVKVATNDPNQYYHVIVKDDRFNCSAMAGGYIRVNVGLLAEVDSYEELALVIAHEMGHVRLHHSWNAYKRERSITMDDFPILQMLTAAGPNGFERLIQKQLSYSRKDEIQADSFAGSALSRAKLSVELANKVHEKMDLRRNEAALYHDVSTTRIDRYSSHPKSEDRTDKMRAFYARTAQRIGAKTFHRLRQNARYVKLRRLRENHRSFELVRAAWRYLHDTPEDPVVLGYFGQGLSRVQQMTDSAELDRAFLTIEFNPMKEVKAAFKKGHIEDDYSQSFISNTLLIPVDKRIALFPYHASANELMRLTLANTNFYKAEEGVLAAILVDPERASLFETYEQMDGRYLKYVKLLKNRKLNQTAKILVIPQRIEVNSSLRVMETYKSLRYYKWDYAQSSLDSLDKSFELLSYIQPLSTKDSIRRLNSFLFELIQYAQRHPNRKLNLLTYDIKVASYLMSKGVEEIIVYDYYGNFNSARSSFYYFNLRNGMHAFKSYSKTLDQEKVREKNLIARQFMETYRQRLKQEY